jgi:predicted DsbA family dithiol-disulfide isomerase
VGLERATWLERRYGAHIEWLPFDLHPEYPPEGIPRAELDFRYGGGRFRERLWAMFDAAGLPYSRDITLVPNSRKALQIGELARERGRFDALHPRLFDAYWARGLDLGDDQVLLAEGAAAGLSEADIRDLLAGDRYLDLIEARTREALSVGASGVPAWVVDLRLLIPGAVPHEVFERAMRQLGHEPVENGAVEIS